MKTKRLTMKLHPALTVLALALGVSTMPAQAQSDAELRIELRQLRAELKLIHAEVDALKAGKTVALAPVTVQAAAPLTAQDIGAPDPRIKPRYTEPDAVPQSAIPGGMVVPGTILWITKLRVTWLLQSCTPNMALPHLCLRH